MSSAPFTSEPMAVEPDWIDYNGHLNMAYYNVLFDRGTDAAFEALGLGPDYLERSGNSFFTAESHVHYLRELREGERVRVTFRILDHDAKRIHVWQEMIHEDGWTSALSETMSLHVRLATESEPAAVAPFPADVSQRIGVMADAHAALARPERAGRPMGIAR